VSGIERGAECARYEPLLSALADGEASPEQLAILRPHMRTCLNCRARLREFRATPERVAALVPPAAVLAADGGGPLRGLLESVIGAAQHKSAALGERVQTAAELATGQKVAAVAASAAALAGAGTAVDEFANHQGPPRPEPAQQVEAKPVVDDVAAETPADPVAETPAAEPAPDAAPAPAPEPPAAPPPPDPATEFAPGGASPQTTGGAAPQATAAPEPAPGGGRGGSGSGSGEFGP
jgi:hypothetical protein